MNQFKTKFRRGAAKGLLMVSMVVALSSCSMSGIVDSTGESLVSVGESLQSLTGHVQVVQVSENVFDLAERYQEPVTNFDSWSMRVKAKQVCDEGYVYQSRYAIRAGEFATDHVMCAEGKSCGYMLEWRIQCKKVPYEPFSLFGKT
ncbi:MAG: hypothetical protein L3J38_06665 [Thiomicrorhabdus sp.]|nr:hypothetical protein [Thiomicrorhabdus sp.]